MTKQTEKGKYIEGIGRRKTAIARVRIYPDEAKKTGIVVNDKKSDVYFTTLRYQKVVAAPLQAVNAKMSVEARVEGGGVTAQAEAIRMGLSRALVTFNTDNRIELKGRGYLTRDARMVERKKYGRRKARRAFQWKKR